MSGEKLTRAQRLCLQDHNRRSMEPTQAEENHGERKRPGRGWAQWRGYRPADRPRSTTPGIIDMPWSVEDVKSLEARGLIEVKRGWKHNWIRLTPAGRSALESDQ